VDNIKRKLSAISVINDYKNAKSLPSLLNIINDSKENDIIICEAIVTSLKIDKTVIIGNLNTILARINNENIAAIINNSLSCSQ
jgi:hypothetical protein